MTGDCHVRPRKLSGLREAWGEIPLAYSTLNVTAKCKIQYSHN